MAHIQQWINISADDDSCNHYVDDTDILEVQYTNTYMDTFTLFQNISANSSRNIINNGKNHVANRLKQTKIILKHLKIIK